MESSIESLREEINRIDESIIKLLSARMEVAKKIAFLKKEMGILVEDRDRERIIFLKLDDDARRNNLDENFVSDGIYEDYKQSSKAFIKALPGIRGFFETFGGGYINEYLDKPSQTISISMLDKNEYIKNMVLNKVSLTFEFGSLLTKPTGYYVGRKIAEKYSNNPNSKNLYSLPTKKENK